MVARGGRVVLVAVEVVVRVDEVLVDVVTPQAGIAACEQTPATVHWSVVQMSPSSVQALPGASRWQSGEQQSPAVVLPSSHCSPASWVPLPQTAVPTLARHVAAATEVAMRALTTFPKSEVDVGDAAAEVAVAHDRAAREDGGPVVAAGLLRCSTGRPAGCSSACGASRSCGPISCVKTMTSHMVDGVVEVEAPVHLRTRRSRSSGCRAR